MDLKFYTAKMMQQAQVIRYLAEGIAADQARWKPNPDTWSILEVVHHLYDEEREDFRVRLEIILFETKKPWPEIDPPGWVIARNYNQQDLAQVLAGFLEERRRSIEWLHSLAQPNWDKTCPTPWGGDIIAGDMFASWVAHDLLHTRQLVEVHWAYTTHQLKPYKVNYAGSWG
jgi:hypothetical protein